MQLLMIKIKLNFFGRRLERQLPGHISNQLCVIKTININIRSFFDLIKVLK